MAPKKPRPKLARLPARIAAQPDRLKTLSTTPGATARTRGGAWMRTRARILKRDGWRCRCSDCAASGRIREATEVDHVTPLELGGADADGNLQAINAECHRIKSARETAARFGKPAR
mgnify:FL=1